MQIKSKVMVLALVGSATLTSAETTHENHDHSMQHDAPQSELGTSASTLSEPGQGAFAALSEVVRVLESDPQTDWSRVDLGALRLHLRDMDRLVSDAVVTETRLPDGLVAIASGDAQTIATLQRMVPAHAAQLAGDGRWTVRATTKEDGAELRVTSDSPSVVARIWGLGFFGLMASQDHHRQHHLMIARGEDAHR